MADTTTRFKVGEIYTIEAHGYGGWNTYELEVTKITSQFVRFSYDAKAPWSRDENGEVVKKTLSEIRGMFRPTMIQNMSLFPPSSEGVVATLSQPSVQVFLTFNAKSLSANYPLNKWAKHLHTN